MAKLGGYGGKLQANQLLGTLHMMQFVYALMMGGGDIVKIIPF